MRQEKEVSRGSTRKARIKLVRVRSRKFVVSLGSFLLIGTPRSASGVQKPLYSHLSASIGSTFNARRAGSNGRQAANARQQKRSGKIAEWIKIAQAVEFSAQYKRCGCGQAEPGCQRQAQRNRKARKHAVYHVKPRGTQGHANANLSGFLGDVVATTPYRPMIASTSASPPMPLITAAIFPEKPTFSWKASFTIRTCGLNSGSSERATSATVLVISSGRLRGAQQHHSLLEVTRPSSACTSPWIGRCACHGMCIAGNADHRQLLLAEFIHLLQSVFARPNPARVGSLTTTTSRSFLVKSLPRNNGIPRVRKKSGRTSLI